MIWSLVYVLVIGETRGLTPNQQLSFFCFCQTIKNIYRKKNKWLKKRLGILSWCVCVSLSYYDMVICYFITKNVFISLPSLPYHQQLNNSSHAISNKYLVSFTYAYFCKVAVHLLDCSFWLRSSPFVITLHQIHTCFCFMLSLWEICHKLQFSQRRWFSRKTFFFADLLNCL